MGSDRFLGGSLFFFLGNGFIVAFRLGCSINPIMPKTKAFRYPSKNQTLPYQPISLEREDFLTSALTLDRKHVTIGYSHAHPPRHQPRCLPSFENFAPGQTCWPDRYCVRLRHRPNRSVVLPTPLRERTARNQDQGRFTVEPQSSRGRLRTF
jgi:hypothetical protein